MHEWITKQQRCLLEELRIARRPLTVEELATRKQLEPRELVAILTQLEGDGYVVELGAGSWELTGSGHAAADPATAAKLL